MLEFPFFQVIEVRYAGRVTPGGERDCTVNMVIKINGKKRHKADEGEGIVNAADKVLRKTVSEYYSDINKVRLLDYTVQAINVDSDGTGAAVQTSILCDYNGHVKKFTGKNHDQAWSAILALIKCFNYFLGLMKEEKKAADKAA